MGEVTTEKRKPAISSTTQAIEARHQEDVRYLRGLSGELTKQLRKLKRTNKPPRWPY